MSIERDELLQLREIAKTMNSPGWGHLMQLWGLERERLIEILSKARLEGKWEFYKGTLGSFDRFLKIPIKARERFEDLQAEQGESI